MAFQRIKKEENYLIIAVLLLVAVRLFVSWFLPLSDTTESRYGEIVRLMVETKDWVVLHIDYDTAFWAKPPLSTWLSAISINLFGLSEFALRLPSFILSVLIVVLVGKTISFDKRRYWLFIFLVFSTPEFIIHAGIVSTDTALNFAIVLAMISFWKAINASTKTIWGYLFFIALGLGCLAKGPLTLVLVGSPIFVWCLTQKKWKQLRQIPWLLGTLLFLLIAVPWYILADLHSPGFLDYFIVGEHFKRYLEPGWNGDLYGGGHYQPFGTIWLFLFLFIPRSVFVIYKLVKDRFADLKDPWLSFLFFGFFGYQFFSPWQLIFFTPTHCRVQYHVR